ncbi:GntR family transcriptional regulator [Streptomyces rapamycinicus]|uniref:GntR family transcriptional regulator n=2 Tax=Streptomyces rapamycinicus TaxID=1226757 RepID=A0A0A0N544_STRRN|nr:GntR family transcriptional regulator [Streptomyces rapamycinicus]AGP54127.1 GntR family transcriptional regulator [Streptomyces rapamycinicus NRRL 5491]MBB4781628.1 DNA-binding GntR family transcriptional regulator [Streptomyces rapamycinicus]RLV73730.1 GntR family transcriptional regulator [Streptomyces rapamycinicus NRRL 5491]UTO62211.1 GntR family transcriptional regulator [Streptomyces rapamycinicus]UTP30165.1 GntR family transcriptional regulator [Streptomyces rapamycinicus NRRL 5491]
MLSRGLPHGAVPKLERPGPLRERVYEALLELITTRALRPGQHLVESELAGQLGVSRQPVREALQRLNTEGWVDLRPAQGAFVHEPTEEEADQLLTVRTLLEAEAARLAAAGADEAGVAALEDLCAKGERAVLDDDVDGAVAANAEFHAKVMELAGNAVLSELAAQVDRRVRWYYTPVARQRGKQSWIEHRELIAAIAAGDEHGATAVMRAHTEHTRRTYHDRERP